MGIRPKPYIISSLTGEAAANIDEMLTMLFDDLANQGVFTDSVIPVAQGGTGSAAAATAGGVAYGTGSAILVNPAGTTGQALLSGGAGAPTWGSAGLTQAQIMARVVLGI